MSAPLYALTIHQPWAWLIATGHKDVENRTWLPPPHLVGQRIAIHVGKHWDPDDLEDALGWAIDRIALSENDLPLDYQQVMHHERGHIIATARLSAVVHASESPWFVGPVGWVLDEVRPVAPVPHRGLQKLWRVDEAIAQRVRP